MLYRLDFRRSLVSGLPSPRREFGAERGLLSRTTAVNRALMVYETIFLFCFSLYYYFCCFFLSYLLILNKQRNTISHKCFAEAVIPSERCYSPKANQDQSKCVRKRANKLTSLVYKISNKYTNLSC